MSDVFLDMEDSGDDNKNVSCTRDIEISRSVYSELQFETKFQKKKDSISNSKFPSCTKCSGKKIWAVVCSLLPILSWLPKYQFKKDLVRDFAGGLTVGIMQVPQGMAYAMLTTLPPIYGLYVSFVPVLVYFLFGTSRHVSLGTFAIVCLMSGDAIENIMGQYQPAVVATANGNFSANSTASQASTDDYKVEVAVSLAFAVGVVQLFLGIIRMGFLTVYLSDPLVSGFTTGAAFHILSSQVRHFLGLKVPAGTNSGVFALFKLYIYFFKNISDVNISALTIGIICTIILFCLKYLNQRYKFRFPIPAELIVVVLGAGISYGAKFNQRYNTPILKSVPKGLPSLTTPSFPLMFKMATEAVTIAIVAFAINVSLVKSFAKKNNYKTDSNQELIAYGVSNMASSFFSCFPSACSLSRSLIQESLGSTQITGLISVVLVILVLLSMAPLFQPLPNAVLAAIVLVALKGLFKQFSVLKSLWTISKIDAFIWFSSFLSVFCLGVDYGLGVGIIITLLSVVGRTSRPSYAILGRVAETEIYKSVDNYNVVEVPNTKIFQYKSSLYYANIEHFQSMLSRHTSDPEDPDIGQKVKTFSTNGIENSGIFINGNVADDSIKMKSYEEIKPNHRGEYSTTEFSFRRANSLPSTLFPEKQEKDEKPMRSLEPFYSDKVKNIILDLSQAGFIDSMAVTTLANIVTDRKKENIEVYLTNCSENVLGMLAAGGFITTHGRHRIFLTVHDAVVYCLSGKAMDKSISTSTTLGNNSTDSISDEIEVKVSKDFKSQRTFSNSSV